MMIRLMLTILLMTGLLVSPAQAQEKAKSVVAAKPVSASALSIGVVDVVALMRQSKAAKSIEKQLNDRRKIYRDALATQEKKLKETEDALIKQKGKLKPEEFETKRKDFEKSVRALQQNAQNKQRALEKAANKSIAQLQDSITKVVAEIAAQKKMKMVLTRDQVVVVDQALDITPAALIALDKALPSVSVTIEDKPAEKKK